MTVRAAWLLPEGQTREDTRLAPVGTVAPETELRSRDGLLAGGNPFAATGAGAMDLQIGTGRAVVQGTDAQGAYPVVNDAPVTVTFADGDAQFARIDTVAIRVYDTLFDTSGQNLARIEIIPGTPDASPTAPTLPPGCLRLWDVTVPPGASAGVGGINWSSALGDRRRYTTAPGGIIPKGWGLAFDGAYDGQYRDNGGALERWDAAADAWTTYRPPAEAPVTATGTTVATAAPGWSLQNAQAVKVSGMITIRAQLERTGADYGPATSEGNLVDLLMFTVTAAWRPRAIFGSERLPALVTDMFGDGAGSLQADTGQFLVVTWAPGASIVKNRLARVIMTYPA
ncbi:hypothetical protein [Streptomyces antimycoticus]|uniref:hypothetical protein n=1 Tax=Streptomyces antimycoticus TaxID=68175 RepID=UPI0033DFB906